MIIGIGTDFVEIPRIQKLLDEKGTRFLDRLFTQIERERGIHSTYPASSLAKRFAAKEALVKAFGLGFSEGISFQDIEIANDPKGKPFMTLKGQAEETLHFLTPSHHVAHIHLSLSDTKTHALAFVLIEGRCRQGIAYPYNTKGDPSQNV